MSSKDNENEQETQKDKEISEIEKKIDASKPKKEVERKEQTPKEEVPQKQKSSPNPKKFEKIATEKENKGTKNKTLFILMSIISIWIIVLLFSTIFALLNLGKTTIAKGVSIKGIDVSNLTVEEATNKINEAINVELLLGMDIIYQDYKVDFDVNQIQYTYDVSTAIREAYRIGKNENIVSNNYELLATVLFGKNIEPKASYQEESLNGIVDDIGAKVPGLVVQPSYYKEGEQLIINRGTDGIIIKKEVLKQDILRNIQNRNALNIMKNSEEEVIQLQVEEAKPEPIDLDKIYQEVYSEPKDASYIAEPFQLIPEEQGVDFAISMEEAKAIINTADSEEYSIPLKLTPAKKTIADIGTEAFPYLISSYTTKYDASNTNRSGNLRLAANKINGKLLMPGEEFSFNEVVGKRTIQEGYRNAKIYENGQVVDGLAGGICQISSTLYNAVLLANLEITERRNHSFTSTYVPAGRDATVVYGTQDFKFKNSRNYPIKIEANVANGIAEFKIHGIKEEVEYDIKIIPVTTQTIPYQTEYVPDATLQPGQQKLTQAGHSGCKVTTYIEKRLGGAVISKKVLSNDTYNAMKAIINVGQ